MAEAALSFLLVLVFIAVFAFFAYGFMGPTNEAQQTQQPDSILTDHVVESGATHHNPHGLDPTVVRALPVLKCSPGWPNGPCVVCLGEFEEGERVKVIPGCGHVFHPGCIDEWLLFHGSCPICRCSQLLGVGVGVGADAGASRVELSGFFGGGAHRHVEDRARILRRSRSFGLVGEGEGSASLQRTRSL